MKYLVSMTTTLLGYLRGELSDTDLQFGCLVFSCQRCHVLGPYPGKVPMEATWGNTGRLYRDRQGQIMRRADALPHLYADSTDQNGSVPVEAVDPHNRDKTLQFVALVAQADREGRVIWGSGNQPEYLHHIAATDPTAAVYWQHGWREAKEFAPVHY